MEVLLSGQAGVAAVLGGSVQLRYVNAPPRKAKSQGAALGVFSGVTDVVKITARNVAEVDAELKHAWSTDRFFRLFDAYLTSDLPPDVAGDVLVALSSLVEDNRLRIAVENRLSSATLPDSAASKIRLVASEFAILKQIFEQSLTLEASIEAVRSSYFGLDDRYFPDDASRAKWWALLVESGSVREWVKANHGGEDLKLLYMKLAARHRNHSAIVALLKIALEVVPRLAHSDRNALLAGFDEVSEFDDFYVEPGVSRAAFENAISQQRVIVEKVRERDFDLARRFADELVQSQLPNSGAERVGKSLCRLAQAAKNAGAPDLQLEWAKRATEVSSPDPYTWGHYADALIGQGLFGDAEPIIEEVRSRGDVLFADTQQARLLRARGRAPEARELYLSTARAFDDQDGVQHTWSGAAETLRDMGRSGEALQEYQILVERWPNDPGVRSGLASALMDVGRHAEAMESFGKAASQERSAVPLNGQATVLKLSGRLAEARDFYNDLLTRFPYEAAVLCGAGDVRRLLGDYDEALNLYVRAAELQPSSHIPGLGISEVLRDQGRLRAALAHLRSLPDQARTTVHVQLAIAVALRNVGEFSAASRQYDAVIQAAPKFSPAVLAKGDFLRRRGLYEDSILLYDRVVVAGIQVQQALAGKAASLIALKRFDEAEKCLRNAQSKTLSGWQLYIVRASLLHARGQTRAAMKLLDSGISRCPFARHKKLMKNLLASIYLDRREYAAALKVADPAPGEPSNVVYLHALCANNRGGVAKKISDAQEAAPDAQQLGGMIVRLFETRPENRGRLRLEVSREEQMLFLKAA